MSIESNLRNSINHELESTPVLNLLTHNTTSIRYHTRCHAHTDQRSSSQRACRRRQRT